MRLTQMIRLIAVTFLTGSLIGLPVITQQVQARGGGGFHGSFGGNAYHGSFGGGSFRPESYHPPEPGPHWGPHPGPGPGPHPGPGPGPHPGPGPYHPYNPNVNVNNVNVTGYGGGWGPYYGGGAWAGAAAGAITGLAVGALISSLPSTAQPLIVNNQNYYYDGTNYYQSCFHGSDSGYCVVQDPNQ